MAGRTGAHVECIVRDSVQTGSWSKLLHCLQQQQLADTQVAWALQIASERASQEDLMRLIPHVPDSHLHPLLTECVKRALWGCVELLMTRGLTQQQQRWALSGVSKRASGADLENIVCHHSVESESLDCVLPNLTKRDQWPVIMRLLPQKMTDSQRRWVMREASKHAELPVLKQCLPHCADDQLDSVLSEVVRRELWSVVSDLLKRPVSDKARRKAVEQVMQASDSEFSTIVCNCTDDQLGLALKAAIDRQMWGVLERLLRRVMDREQLQWAVLEAMKHADEDFISRLIEEHCDDLKLGPALSEAVRKRLWRCVGDLLKHGGLEARKRWAVEEASKYASETQLLSLLHHCADDQIDSILVEVVKRHLWDCALDLLRRRVDVKLMGWVVEEASKHACEDKLRPFLRYCCHEVVDTVLTELVVRRLWHAADRLLKRHRETHCIKVALEKAAEHLQSQCDAEVRKAVRSHAWTVVSKMLLHWPITDKTRILVVDRVCRSGLYHSNCGDGEFASIVQHCDVTQLAMTLEAAVKRNMPHAACDILTRLGQYGDPRTVTRDGQTVLVIAMESKECRQRLVKECIKLGVSTHQPDVTDFYLPTIRAGTTRPAIMSMPDSISPMERAFVNNDSHIVRMLYESGSCSNKELHYLHAYFSCCGLQSQKFQTHFHELSAYIARKATTPRNLASLCRLVISHHLGVGCRRQERVQQLPLPEPLRCYVIFSDIISEDTDHDIVSNDNERLCDEKDIRNGIKEIAYELCDFQSHNQ